MALYTNHNVVTLPMAADGKYKIGDVFKSTAYNDRRFDGLIIRNISYCFGVCLHFDWHEWKINRPEIKVESIEQDKRLSKHLV